MPKQKKCRTCPLKFHPAKLTPRGQCPACETRRLEFKELTLAFPDQLITAKILGYAARAVVSAKTTGIRPVTNRDIATLQRALSKFNPKKHSQFPKHLFANYDSQEFCIRTHPPRFIAEILTEEDDWLSGLSFDLGHGDILANFQWADPPPFYEAELLELLQEARQALRQDEEDLEEFYPPTKAPNN